MVTLVVLAGGKGRRLRPFKDDLPKSLTPIPGTVEVGHMVLLHAIVETIYIDETSEHEPHKFWSDLVESPDDIDSIERKLKRSLEKGGTREVFETLARMHLQTFWMGVEEPRYILEKTLRNERLSERMYRDFPGAKQAIWRQSICLNLGSRHATVIRVADEIEPHGLA